ncbi:MAG: oxidoreductase [Hyphococcus sp.]|nr:MAG: oxidoreductase [Marinicaulis sp.]
MAGAGVFGGYHCSKISDLAQAELACVFDIDQQRASALAETHQTTSAASFAALLDQADAVVIATPAIAHYELAEAALRSKRHVFVEKPIALTTREASQLIALAQAAGVVLQVGHQERYVAHAAGLFDRKSSPVKVNCVRQTSSSGRCEDVSVVLDLMIHDIDLIRTLTDAELKSASASGDMHAVEAELVLSNGASVMLTASRRSATPERRMNLVYEDGLVEFDFVNRKATNTTPFPLHADFSDDALPLAFRDPLGFGADAFVKAVLAGSAPIVRGEDGRRALEWALAIERAAGIRSAAEQTLTSERLRA